MLLNDDMPKNPFAEVQEKKSISPQVDDCSSENNAQTSAALDENILPILISFQDLQLHPDILSAILRSGYTQPTPIQQRAIPAVLAGKDVMGAAQTGTGKTAAFTLPILQRLMTFANQSASPARHALRALILTPTRELANQVSDSVLRYGKSTPLRSAVIFGGMDIAPQKEALRQGVELLIATPGRLLDHLEQRSVSLAQVQTLVLDEADRMLDMGFLPDLEKILKLLPKQRQTLLFSATFSPEIRKLARTYLVNPVEIEVAAANATAENIRQVAYAIAPEHKRAAVVHLVKSNNLKQVIVFSNTKIGTARLARQLEQDGILVESIHGDKSQQERMKALEAFKKGDIEVLVATDVAARGLDIAGVPCVINYDLPHHAEDYVHRIGRTARAGASGDAISLFSPDDETYLLGIEKFIQKTMLRKVLVLPESQEPARIVSTSRSAPVSRSGSSRSGSSHSSSLSGHAKRPQKTAAPKDDWFNRPYVPQLVTQSHLPSEGSGVLNGNPVSATSQGAKSLKPVKAALLSSKKPPVA